ncbi:hypothetical protein ACKKBG_A02355 [Auxenochlorella protothecoides x Auxenochlorella symbiontica]|uniref:Uncharacterized protein n=1 Tax=Auxenochlorella protothecoides TaxID=3075 RepID=A0A1D2AFV9_AUXPR|nr:hypothetical protein APUTEX25_001684 [Auxenochlorella protothecoides]|eukprot:RMZ52294.1 hypothetical protein APUTEX25_001684 [Auxenochlorella protothecoides]
MHPGYCAGTKRGWEHHDDDLLDNMFAHKRFAADAIASDLQRLQFPGTDDACQSSTGSTPPASNSYCTPQKGGPGGAQPQAGPARFPHSSICLEERLPISPSDMQPGTSNLHRATLIRRMLQQTARSLPPTAIPFWERMAGAQQPLGSKAPGLARSLPSCMRPVPPLTRAAAAAAATGSGKNAAMDRAAGGGMFPRDQHGMPAG